MCPLEEFSKQMEKPEKPKTILRKFSLVEFEPNITLEEFLIISSVPDFFIKLCHWKAVQAEEA